MASSEQVGGTHYQSDYQHWDFVEDVGMGYLEGYASKYLVRWKKTETPLKDLKKARSAVSKLIEKEKQVGCFRSNRAETRDYGKFMRFATANELKPNEHAACLLLYYWMGPAELEVVLDIINTLIQQHFPEEFEAKLTNADAFAIAPTPDYSTSA